MRENHKQTPQKPQKGDVPACEAYAHYCAAISLNPRQTCADIWFDFIMSSFLSDKEMNV